MSKHSTSSPLNSQDFLEGWLEHPAIEWISTNRKILSWSLLGLLAVLILAYRVLSLQTLRSEGDFFRSQVLFQEIQQADKERAIPLVQELSEIMDRHPELHAKYDGPLAQMMIIDNQPVQAEKFAKSMLKRVKPDHLQAFESYAQSSLFISQGDYEKALNNSQSLQTTSTLLKTFNLLRLAVLHQQMNQPQGELAAWNAFLQESNNDPASYHAVSELFQAGDASLAQYIEKRKQEIE